MTTDNRTSQGVRAYATGGPIRVTIVCGDLQKLPLAALEYLVLHVNTLQRDVQYESYR